MHRAAMAGVMCSLSDPHQPASPCAFPWQGVMAPIAQAEPELQERLTSNARAITTARGSMVTMSRSGSGLTAGTAAEAPPMPWRAFLRSTPIRALMYTHFAHNW